MSVATSAVLKNVGGIVGFTDVDVPDPELLKACVHCGMCLSSCPTYRITGQEMSSPRGRLWLMSAVSHGRLSVDDEVFDEQMYQCLNCRACEAVCPSGVQYGPLVEASRAQLEQHRPRPRIQRGVRKVTLGWLFSDIKRLRFMIGALRLYQKTGADRIVRRTGILKPLKMQELESMMPPISKSFMHAGDDSWSPKNKRDAV